MNKNTIPTIIFGFLTYGAAQETFRIFTSDAPDIARDRSGLSIMGLVFTGLFLATTIYFLLKKPKQ
ncbi:hypothetical protein [Ferruginibacter sp.]